MIKLVLFHIFHTGGKCHEKTKMDNALVYILLILSDFCCTQAQVQLGTVVFSNVSQTTVKSAFDWDYFQLRVNTHLEP